jgi:PKD repeat protein
MSGLTESTTYFVRAYATNSEGTSYGQQVSFSTLIKPPEADFSATPSRVPAGGSIQFNDLSANSPSAWSWNFGDGTTSTEKNPLHVYSNEGTYTVSLTVTNASGSNTRTKENYITVDPAVKVPVADFIFSKDKIKAGETVQFTDKSLNVPASWKWNFGDDSTSTLQNPVHKYSSAGLFTVSLVATNSAGSNTKSIPNCITVEPQVPIADFTASLTIVTVGQAVQFTDQSVNSPASWKWDFGDGSSSAVQNPGHAYTNPGKYTVSLTVSNVSGSNAKTKDNYITVNPEVKIPAADFIYSKSKIKTGETVQFTDKSLNAPASWKWNFGDDSTSTLQNPVHKYSSAGVFTVSIVATNSAGSNTKTIPNCITVEPQVPVAAFSASLTIVPVGQTVQFTDQSENSPVSWTWDFGDGSSSALKNPSHAYANSGKYTVSLIVTNVSGSDTETKTDYITAGLPPNAGFTVSQANPKMNQSVTFTDQSTNAPLKWSWDFGDKLTSQVQNPDHAYAATGKYTVSLTVTNPFGSDTETKTDYIDVMPLPPVADFIAVPTSIFEGERIQFTDKSLNNPTSWSWNFGDASQDTRQNPLHGYSDIGIYNPSLTVSNNSGRDTKTRNNYIFVSRKIEAETADTIKTGTIDSNDPGFTGTGFVNLENIQGT